MGAKLLLTSLISDTEREAGREAVFLSGSSLLRHKSCGVMHFEETR